MATLIVPVLSNFVVLPREYGTPPFNLTNPTSTNTSTFSTYTFTTDTSGSEIISISGRTVTILKSGNANITATQSASFGFSSGSITTLFTVNVAIPALTNFVIPQKSFSDISFSLTDPTSNSNGSVVFRSLTTDIVSVSGRIVKIKRVGRARIEATKNPSGSYGTASIVAEFDILTSIVRVGVQNQIDLSWNRPTENGATIKNYFFYVEERISNIIPAPSVNTIMETVPLTTFSYYSYKLPVPYYAPIISSNGLPNGIDIIAFGTFYNITTLLSSTEKNYFDLGFYGQIEISWIYDRRIVEINPDAAALTTMTLSLYKEASNISGDNRVDLLRNIERNYDSNSNCLGPRPQNNNKTMTDIFTIVFDSTTLRELKYLKPTDVVTGMVKFSSLSYSPASAPTTTLSYSITIKGIRIVPYRLALTREFTSLGFGAGNADTGVGFSVSTVNAAAPITPFGILYHMPRITEPLTDFNEAKWTFSWNYGVNISRLTTDISLLPVNGNISNLNIPFRLRIQGYSRPYSHVFSSILTEQYNTTNVAEFLSNINDPRYYTRRLFDVILDSSASYAEIVAGTTVTRTFDISGSSNFPAFSTSLDSSHTQFVFLFQLTINDTSYNQYFQAINSETDSFRVKMLSQTFTPRQEYRFAGPDPTIASSNDINSSTNTLYNLSDAYTNIAPYYRFYNLINGIFYSYQIASNSRFGTSGFSESFTRRCGSIPNQLINRLDINGRNTLLIESEKTTSQVNIYWEKPDFSGYEIKYFVIQMTIDASGRWLTFLDYTPDIDHNTITFNTFEDTIVVVTDQTLFKYEKIITNYKYKSNGVSGPLINGSKYYFRIASVNELGYSLYSSILTGIPFSRPENTPIEFYGNPIIGNQLIYISWKIPIDDGGSPILNYIIDYEEVIENIQNGVTISTKYINKKRYKLNISEPTRSSYPFIDFRDVYAGYKNFNALSLSDQRRLSDLRSQLTSYVIPPRPITFNDADFNQNFTTIPNRNVKLSYTQQYFSYISSELNQNVFDLNNLQLRWYYRNDPTGSYWDNDAIEVSFGMSIRGHLKDISGNTAKDIDNIFYIPNDANGGVTYKVNRTLFELSQGRTKYIDYRTGSVIPEYTVSAFPKIFVTKPLGEYIRIDSYNNKRYKLQIDFSMNYISSSIHKFILYSAPIIMNGTAPVRTNPGLNTIFTVKIENNALSPIINDIKYRFEITPFNLNDFFPDTRNRLEQRISTTIADPVTDMSYSLIPTSAGGKVVLQWHYAAPSDYQINITIPVEYRRDIYPEEYPQYFIGGSPQSIFATNLRPVNEIITYSIPSDNPDDISNGFFQQFLKSGRGYTITVAPVKRVEVNGEELALPAEARDFASSGTFIVPFRTPLRPLTMRALGNNGVVSLKWNLPNFLVDPNYYTTIYPNPFRALPFYSYRFYSLERRNISAGESSWTVENASIEIASGSVGGTETTYNVTGLLNENNYQFRIRLMIVNDYNGQRAFSEYSYMTSINNVSVNENNPENTIYPSLYPYKPGMPILNDGYASRTSTSTGILNGLSIRFDYPAYNGNADYYECYIEYTHPPLTPGSGTLWYDIFDTRSDIGIANISDNLTVLDVNQRLRTTLLSQTTFHRFVIRCKSNLLQYGIRIRLLGRKTGLAEPYPFFLYSDYSSVDYISF